jgi:hypothetical protein
MNTGDFASCMAVGDWESEGFGLPVRRRKGPEALFQKGIV